MDSSTVTIDDESTRKGYTRALDDKIVALQSDHDRLDEASFLSTMNSLKEQLSAARRLRILLGLNNTTVTLTENDVMQLTDLLDLWAS